MSANEIRKGELLSLPDGVEFVPSTFFVFLGGMVAGAISTLFGVAVASALVK